MKYERGRFRRDGIVIRRLRDGTKLVFCDDALEIYLFPIDGPAVVFHQYGNDAKSYLQQWKPFCRKLLNNKRINLTGVQVAVMAYNIDSFTTNRTITEIIAHKEVFYK